MGYVLGENRQIASLVIFSLIFATKILNKVTHIFITPGLLVLGHVVWRQN